LKNPQKPESKIGEGKEESRGSDVNSIQRGIGEMGKEPLAVEEENDSSGSAGSFKQPIEENENVDVIEQDYDGIKGTRGTYCKWTDENGMINIESGEKCASK
jgi:hypothetical protein